MTALAAYHGDKAIKAKYLSRVRAHAKADEIIKGVTWENGKGCAVGCTLHAYSHSVYETELGIPEWLARLEDTLFEGMSPKAAKRFPARFLAAIHVGADLDSVKSPFLLVVLEHAKQTVASLSDIDESLRNKVLAAIRQCADLHRPGRSAAASAARSAASAWSAASAARSAASAAESARSAWSAWSAARSAASAAESARSAWSAESAESAARSAESAARSAESAARSAESAAESAYDHYAEALLLLLAQCRPSRKE